MGPLDEDDDNAVTLVSPRTHARLFALTLHDFRATLLRVAPPEARADVARLLDEAEHAAACACAAAGIHPRARHDIATRDPATEDVHASA